MAAEKREVIVIFHDHLDPVWARCNDRPYQYNQIVLRSYADVFDWVIQEFIKMSDEGFIFSEGQAVVWETYMKRHPEEKGKIKELVAQGNLELMRQGMSTVDSNYSPAEAIIRNHLLAEPFYQEMCGDDYWPNKQAFLWDAFGNSANMPQILKLLGIEVIGGTKYRLCPGDWWVGIDGTKLPCIDQIFSSYNRTQDPILYVLSRHPHCPDCNGRGCEKCNNKGILNAHPYKKEKVLEVLEKTAAFNQRKKFVMIGGEETIPDHSIIESIEELNKKYEGNIHFRFGTMKEFWEYYKEYYMSVKEQYTEPTEDLNPVNQGAYVAKIRCKQRAHEINSALIQAEAAFARKHWESSSYAVTPEDLTLAWKDLVFGCHHDAISGAHIDGCDDELMQILDEGESIAHNYVCRTKYRVPKVGRDTSKEEMVHKTLGKLNIVYDKKGIISVEKDGKDLFGKYKFKGLSYTGMDSRDVRIGELLLEDDWGDFHNTISSGEPILLGDYNYFVSEGMDFIWWRGAREVMDPRCPKLTWDVYLKISEDGEKLNFSVDIDWETTNKRIRAIIPVNDTNSMSSVWGIPFGHIERSFDPNKKYEMPVADHESMTTAEYDFRAICPVGDFPADHWAVHAIDENSGVCLFNKGTPCVKWLPGCFELSLLRSPQMEGITILPHVEEFWDVKGITDSGKHHFEFAVYPYTEHVGYAELAQYGYVYNDATPELPFEVTGNIVVTAFKVAEDGRGYILRFYEAEGCNNPVQILFKEKHKVQRVNLLEKPLDEQQEGNIFDLNLHPHEIVTLRIL